MQDMSDDEADHIVVAMAGPHGPLGDAFEVDAAARARAPAPTPTPSPPPTAAAASASDAAPAPAPPGSPAAAVLAPANNTRLVRVKAQLCRLWRVAPAVLDTAFDSRSRDFFAKLCRLAQMPNVDFRTAQVELTRARFSRIHGTAIDLPLRGVSRDRAWAPSDVDRAIEALGGAAHRPAVSAVPAAPAVPAVPAAPASPTVTVTVVPAAASVRKRTAAETPAETPHKRQRSSASGTSGASMAYAESSRGIPIDPALENETGYESDRASVPRAASIERELERRQESQQEPRPQRRATEGQSIRVQTPARQDSTRPQRADPLPAHATGNGVPPPTPGETPMGSFDGTEDCVSSPAVLAEKAVRAAVKDSQYDRSEALRRLESCETLPPHVFHQLLQDFCCANASQVVHEPITAASVHPPPHLPFLLNNYDSFILPFYLGGRWSVATINPKHKEATLYGPSSALNTTQTATERFLEASLNTKDAQSWRMTRVPVASPPDPQDEPIICLVTAIHIIASSVPHPSSAETDPFFWRHALAAFVRGGTSAAAKRPPIITAALVPPMIIPLSIAAFFTHLETHLATTRTRHNADLARLRTRARSYEGAYALLDALASGPHVTAELAAYAARDAQLPGAIENVESTIASLQRLGIDGTVRELEECAHGLREVRRRDDARVARLKDMEEVRESIRGGLAALEEREKAEMERLEGASAEAWRQAEVAWAGLKGRFGREDGGG